MAETVVPVRRNGKTYRLATNGEKAALFGKTGIVETLRVAVPATAPGRLPTLETLDGHPVQFTRASAPCSCTGFPWNANSTALRDQVV